MESFFKPQNIEVYNRLKLYFDLVEEILLFSQTVTTKIETSIKQRNQSKIDAFQQFILLCFFKATSHGMNIWMIASIGHRVEAAILLKPVIELYIYLRYITNHNSKEHNKLSEDFFHYINLKEKSTLLTGKEIAEKYDDPIVNSFNQSLNEINRMYPKGKLNEYWPNKSVQQLAKSANLEQFYKTVYCQYSGYSHLSRRAFDSYFNQDNLNWQLSYSIKNIDEILITFCDIYIDIIKTIECGIIGHPFTKVEYFEKQLKLLKNNSLSKYI